MAGIKWSDIAETVWGPGAHPSTAQKAVARALDEYQSEAVEGVRQIEVRRIERMIQALWPAMLDGKWLAVDRIIKLQERKAQLLGLDAPQKRIVEVVTPEAIQEALATEREEVDRLRKQLSDVSPTIDADLSEIDKEVMREIEAGRRELVTRAEQIMDADVVEDDDAS